MLDAGLSAFSVFFMQAPSFLNYQSRMQQQQGNSNAQSLFGIHQIPGSNQIRNLLDPVSPGHLYPLLVQTSRQLKAHGYLDTYRDGMVSSPLIGIYVPELDIDSIQQEKRP